MTFKLTSVPPLPRVWTWALRKTPAYRPLNRGTKSMKPQELVAFGQECYLRAWMATFPRSAEFWESAKRNMRKEKRAR